MPPTSIHLLPTLLGLLVAASLASCTSGVQQLPTLAAMPTSTARPPTATPTYEYIPSPYPTSLEAFGMHYDPSATLSLPPWGSISMLFWGQGIPMQPYLSTPEFIAYPTPRPSTSYGEPGRHALLAQAGCQVTNRWRNTQCLPSSLLLDFDCDWIMDVGEIAYLFNPYPGKIDAGLDPHTPLVAECEKKSEQHEAAKAGGLYLTGCAFKYTVRYIFKVDGEYVLASNEEELRSLLAPIDTPEEALSYVQLATGLEAIYTFDYDLTLMYFHATISGTHVTQAGSAYDVILFAPSTCGCEPWITTQFTLRVEPSGQITWQDAVPLYMTTGWSCAD